MTKAKMAGDSFLGFSHGGYNLGMAIYVAEYRLKKKEDDKSLDNPEYEIQYSEIPIQWESALVEGECRILNGMQVHFGRHYCQFEVEKLNEDRFAIVCKSHPSLVMH